MVGTSGMATQLSGVGRRGVALGADWSRICNPWTEPGGERLPSAMENRNVEGVLMAPTVNEECLSACTDGTYEGKSGIQAQASRALTRNVTTFMLACMCVKDKQRGIENDISCMPNIMK